MVRRILNVFYKEMSGLHEAAFLLGAFALFSKILALVRDRILAHHFGAGSELDIYYAAFRLPDLIYFSAASLLASAIVIPFIFDRVNRKEAARQFFNSLYTVFCAGMTAVSIIGFFLAPFLAPFVAPGFPAEAHEELTTLTRILLLSPFFLGLSGLFASITQAFNRFLVYALSPVFYNAGIIVGILFLYPVYGLSGLAWGVIVGSILHAAIQVPTMTRLGFFPRFTNAISLREMFEVFAVSLPRTAALSAQHITLLVLVASASLFEEGSITVFNFSMNLQMVPLSIIGVSYSVAAFPTLSRLHVLGESARFIEQVVVALRHIIFWSMPVTVLFIILRAQIVRAAFGTGQFGWTETRLTAAALAIFSLSIVAQSALLVIVRAYYASGKTRTPLLVALFSSILTIGSAFLLEGWFKDFETFRFFVENMLRVENVPGTALLMLPLAFSFGAVVNTVALWFFFVRDFGASHSIMYRSLRQSFAASVVMGFVAYHLLQLLDDVFDINTFFGIVFQGFFAGLGGLCALVAILYLMKNEEFLQTVQTLRRATWKTKPIAPDQGEL